MKNIKTTLLFLVIFIGTFNYAQTTRNELTAEEKNVILNKGTEMPFSGKYNNFTEEGVYACKQCGSHLYHSTDKFKSHCGWPSFDDEIKGAVLRIPDRDGKRTEIVCSNCKAHLGHVFLNEAYTSKNTRHCVNSLSLEFIPSQKYREIAIFAGGCFWGVEYLMESQDGVISVESGYIGGLSEKPSYQLVCSKTTNFAEAVKVVFDHRLVSYESLAKLFFEIHDPTQDNRQGPDIGKQYRSEIFYMNQTQKETAQKLINQLKAKGYRVKTELTKATAFYKAEEYHQNYYLRKKSTPYCHKYTKRF